ncbi:MAG: mannonate dehydratase [Acidobacteriaceae bacterium]|nr:mannonate dehydratase [Acidobacteriaceae bacterium]
MSEVDRRRTNTAGMQLAELFYPGDEHKIRIARQVGITHAFFNVSPILGSIDRDLYSGALRVVKSNLESAGLVFAGVESHPVPAEKIKLGLAGRDEEIENYIAAIRALSQLGVRLICYNWMGGLGWYRTQVNVAGRGGALVSEFRQSDAEKQGLTPWGQISEKTIWDNLEYFLRAIIPVAEQHGVKMALHPDDPPISPLRGIGRILTSAESFRQVLRLMPSAANGITFCQANFKLMGGDLTALVREWCAQNKIFFVHFRDVAGTREHFVETFHDNGPTDLVRMLQTYHDCGFAGPIRPDHAPTLDGERNDRPGYSIGGKILAIGYMKGIMDTLGIPYAKTTT